MEKNRNIAGVHDCYGCGVCVVACPMRIISLRESACGFYEPVISDISVCTNCGLCLSVCAHVHDEVSPGDGFEVESYAAWNLNPDIRYRSSSGGIGFALAAHFIKQGYKACGVRYDPRKHRAEHFISDSEADFIPSIGSKYLPSWTASGFSQFDRQHAYFVVGTPCQVDSLRRWTRKMRIEEHFFLVDFFCHGVPSLKMWDSYLLSVAGQTGSIRNAAWRDKNNGWHDSYVMNLQGEIANYKSALSHGDSFYRLFLGHTCLGRACLEKCKYKQVASAADVRIGDFWGRTYEKDQEGVSAVIALSRRGQEALQALSTCQLEPVSLETATEGQMKTMPVKPWVWPFAMHAIRAGSPPPLSRLVLYDRIYRISLLPKRILRKIIRILREWR